MRQIVIDYMPTPKQRLFHQSDANEVLYGGAAGGGKLLWIHTPILTPNGFVEIGDLDIGDYVYGPDGIAHPVTQASAPREHEAWRFTFDDGSVIDCDGEHLWFTYTAADLQALSRRTDAYRAKRRETRARRGTGRRNDLAQRNSEHPTPCKDGVTGAVRMADEIVKTLRTHTGRSNHAIPVCAPVEMPERALPLDPYLLGLWLGDGAARGGNYTGIDGLEAAFTEAGFTVTHGKKAASHYVLGLVPILKAIGVYGNKHIPDEYLFASKGQRIALLQGLMDTDGNCNVNGTAEFTNKNRRLADGAAFLIRSLGMKCRVSEKMSRMNGKDCGLVFRIKFTPTLPVFRLERKARRQKTEFRQTLRYRYIVRAERIPPIEMRCIAIDSADHLYLAGESLIPTHNSKAIVMDALMRCLAHPETHAYIFRRTYRELEDTIIAEARRSYPQEIARYNVGRHEMVLYNGSVIHFRHCASVGDMYDYSGAEIHWLYFDELTTFEREIYDFLRTRLRAKKTLGVVPIVRCASNPGNIGHGWVKDLFVDAGPFLGKVEHVIQSDAIRKERRFTTQYIPSLATENPHITDDYIFELERKPEALKRALLYGEWDAFEGQVFIEWKDDKEHYKDRRWTHVIEPFRVPLGWPRYMSFDHGYSRPFVCLWWAVAPDGAVYLYREWYGWDGTPNRGAKLSPRQIAEGIVDREREEEGKEGLLVDRIADPSIFDRSRGDSVAMQMEPDGVRPGVSFTEGDNARIAGKMQLHERLRFDADGRPKLQVFSVCRHFIRTIPTLPYDLNKPEDVDSDAEDHAYDATRYFLMANPLPVPGYAPRVPKPYSPFEAAENRRYR